MIVLREVRTRCLLAKQHGGESKIFELFSWIIRVRIALLFRF